MRVAVRRVAAVLAQGEKLIYQNLEPKGMSNIGKNGKKPSQGTKAKIHFFMYLFLIQETLFSRGLGVEVKAVNSGMCLFCSQLYVQCQKLSWAYFKELKCLIVFLLNGGSSSRGWALL